MTSRSDVTMKSMTSSADASSGRSGRGEAGRADDFTDVFVDDDADADVFADVDAVAVVFFAGASLIQWRKAGEDDDGW